MRFVVAVCLVCGLVAGTAGAAIIVDCNGGGDYVTIQEGVDAAANGDTVIVWPCVYTDVHAVPEYGDCLMNVYFEKNITLMSSDGPEVTIIDGEGAARYCVRAHWADCGNPPPVVEGFTVRNGSSADAIGIYIGAGEARGNVAEGFQTGICATTWYNEVASVVHGNTCIANGYGIRYYGRGCISGNTVDGNDTGVLFTLRYSGDDAPIIDGNTATGNGVGIRIQQSPFEQLIAGVTVVGNSVSGNTKGVYVSNSGESGMTTTLQVTMVANQVFDNSEENLRVEAFAAYSSTIGHVLLEMGGSLESANDLHGSPVNIHASQADSAVATITATHNYWGSTLCSEFVPLFLLKNIPEPNFEFLPFTDETHTELFPVCESSAVSATSWGCIKALYR